MARTLPRHMSRPPSPPPTPSAVRRLQRLLEREQRAKAEHQHALEELHAEAKRVCDEGPSRRAVAESLGVSTSAVQHWVKLADKTSATHGGD